MRVFNLLDYYTLFPFFVRTASHTKIMQTQPQRNFYGNDTEL